ncbi:GTP 3',8-cyclase MoaA [Geopsychrobacter electrodiphilus]|uniref:GTP 3',8-cyclase MoaA n=1 Tax=Geopsychrobacter electrodiphilus TaxID=225196 RepID=UPI0003761266|nr:GTP 3',8-cyclase MoaA [Geopsychrobacter electrodiphilus]
MRDTFNRKIDYLRISVTDRCNLRCRYCMPEEGVPSVGHGQVLSFEELFRVARIAVEQGVCKIRLTGGEPLVRKGLISFVERLCQLPQQPELTLTSNGLLLAAQAGELKSVGLQRVNVSLDTLKPERFEQITRRPGLEQVLAGIYAAEAAGLLPLKLNMVPIRGVNADEIADFARLTFAHNWQVRFIEFMPVSGGLDYPPESRFSAAEITEVLRGIAPLQELARKGPAGPARLFQYAGAKGVVGVIPAVSEHFCGECNRLRLTSDGFLRPCLFCENEIDLRTPLRAGCSDDDLVRLLRGAVEIKPERHHLAEEQGVQTRIRKMQGIGG